MTADSAAFALRRSESVWQVLLEGEQDFLSHTTGMTFIEHYLKHPGEAIHPVVLLARLQGQEPVQQRSGAVWECPACAREMSHHPAGSHYRFGFIEPRWTKL